ncbi:MAG: metal ABC transporter permease [Solirubrobacterales bacterium]
MTTELVTASLLAPLTGDFGATSAAELALIGSACGAVGVWILFFNRAFLAESFGHALLPGLVIAAALGGSLLLGAILGVGLAYVVLSGAERVARTSTSTATSVTVTAMVAAGALLATRGTGAGGFESLLFGDPLAADWLNVVFSAAIAVVIGGVLMLFHERFTALAFDRQAAGALRLGVAQTNAVLIAVIVFAIAVAASTSGSLLALALLLGPAIATTAIGRVAHARLSTTIIGSAALGSLVGVGGLYLSYYANWPASPSVALISCGMAVVGAATARTIAVTRRSPASGRGSPELA